MLRKTDLLVLLNDLSKKGLDITEQVRKLMSKSEIPVEVLKFINDNRHLKVTEFYEQLRKSYNAKRSSLYINLVKDQTEAFPALATLSSLNLQIILFAKHLEASDVPIFLTQVRAAEIADILKNYYTTFNLMPVLEMLTSIKADIKSFESLKY